MASLRLLLLFLSLSAWIKAEETTFSVYNITASDTLKFVWFRNAKVCTRTILNVLGSKTPFSVTGFRIPYNPEAYKSHFKFAFVRNPWDRVVSCYSNKVLSKAHPPFVSCYDKGFDHFVHYIDRLNLARCDIHLRLQTKLIPMDQVDFIGRFENFAHDFQYVLNRLGIVGIEIPLINVTKHAHYSQYYTKKTRQIIARKYRADIEAFGYQFETPE